MTKKTRRRSGLFRSQEDILLVEEPLSMIVLPTLSDANALEDDTVADEFLVEDEPIEDDPEPQAAAPLRIFLGTSSVSDITEIEDKGSGNPVWDLSAFDEDIDFFEEDLAFEDKDPPLPVSLEPEKSPQGTSSVGGGLINLAYASIPVEDDGEPKPLEGNSERTNQSSPQNLSISLPVPAAKAVVGLTTEPFSGEKKAGINLSNEDDLQGSDDEMDLDISDPLDETDIFALPLDEKGLEDLEDDFLFEDDEDLSDKFAGVSIDDPPSTPKAQINLSGSDVLSEKEETPMGEEMNEEKSPSPMMIKAIDDLGLSNVVEVDPSALFDDEPDTQEAEMIYESPDDLDLSWDEDYTFVSDKQEAARVHKASLPVSNSSPAVASEDAPPTAEATFSFEDEDFEMDDQFHDLPGPQDLDRLVAPEEVDDFSDQTEVNIPITTIPKVKSDREGAFFSSPMQPAPQAQDENWDDFDFAQSEENSKKDMRIIMSVVMMCLIIFVVLSLFLR